MVIRYGAYLIITALYVYYRDYNRFCSSKQLDIMLYQRIHGRPSPLCWTLYWIECKYYLIVYDSLRKRNLYYPNQIFDSSGHLETDYVSFGR